DDDLAARAAAARRRFRWRARHLLGDAPAQIGDEFRARRVTTLSSRTQFDRRADLRGLEVVGRERPWPAPSQQVVDITSQPSRIHGWPPSLTCAASRRARCWSTLALATLIPSSAADSLIELPRRKRDSKIWR